MNKHSTKHRKIEVRRVRVSELFRSGVTNAREIAERLGVSRPTIVRDLAALDLEWRDERVRNYTETKEDLLNQLQRTRAAAWSAWETSREPFNDLRKKIEGLLGEGDGPELFRAMGCLLKTQPGNPRFLQVLHDSLEKQIKMLGFYNVEQVDQTQTVRFDFRDCSTEELLMLRNFAEAQQTQQAQQGAPARAVEEDIEEGEEQTIGGDRT